MIEVSGVANLKVPYSVNLEMTEAEFDALSETKQNELLDSRIDWHDACRSAEVDEFEVDDVIEFDDGESA